jgi:hypothetical protein
LNKFTARRRRGIIIIIRRNGAKTISLQTSFGVLIITKNGAKTIVSRNPAQFFSE